MPNWRFKNLLPSLENAIDAKHEDGRRRISSPLPDTIEKAQEELNDYLVYDLGMVADRRYGFGRPMDEVVDAMTLIINLRIRRQEILLHVISPRINTLPPEAVNAALFEVLRFGGIVEESLLVARGDLLEKGKNLLWELTRSGLLLERHAYKDYAEVMVHLANSETEPSMIDNWERFRKQQRHDLEDYKYVDLMLTGNHGQLNSSLQKRVYDRFGSERTRSRRKNIAPNERFSREILGTVALALHNGLPLTFKDEAIPIHEFPIAQRPEIKALLPG